jgi:hypothetical protein
VAAEKNIKNVAADSAKKTAYLPQTARQIIRTRFRLMAFGQNSFCPFTSNVSDDYYKSINLHAPNIFYAVYAGSGSLTLKPFSWRTIP